MFPQAIAADRKREAPDPVPVAGGNLIVAGDYLLIATPKKLIAYAVNHAAKQRDERPVTVSPSPLMGEGRGEGRLVRVNSLVTPPSP